MLSEVTVGCYREQASCQSLDPNMLEGKGRSALHGTVTRAAGSPESVPPVGRVTSIFVVSCMLYAVAHTCIHVYMYIVCRTLNTKNELYCQL